MFSLSNLTRDTYKSNLSPTSTAVFCECERGCFINEMEFPSIILNELPLLGLRSWNNGLRCMSNNRVHYVRMAVCVYLHIILPHYNHYTDVYESTELLKCLSDTFNRMCVNSHNYLSCNILECVYSANPVRLGKLLENVCLILSSSWNWKHEPLAIG